LELIASVSLSITQKARHDAPVSVALDRERSEANMPKPNELERLLDLACSEPGYAPEFFRCLLRSEVFAFVPTVGNGLDEGKVRFVMWTYVHGGHVIPCFASLAAVRRGSQPGWQAVKIQGRRFLEQTRGATVALNPNEPTHCHLTPPEVAALLDTGAISNPEAFRPAVDSKLQIERVVHTPAATLHSLAVFFSTYPNVHRAYVVLSSVSGQSEAPAYLVVVRMDELDTERLIRESAQVMNDVPPGQYMDLATCFHDADQLLQAVASVTAPFYDRAWGGRMVAPESTCLM
jgi:SseB protein C-terminal domain/SseB protein N-terminal domain